MKKKIDNNFCGILKFASVSNEHDAFFHVVDDFVTVLPKTGECKKEIDSLIESSVSISPKWLFGFTENGCSVAFFMAGRVSVNNSYPVDLHPLKFRAPIILQSTGSNDIDLQTFDEIEFRGGIIDLLHVPTKAIERSFSDNHINFRSTELYTRVFSVNMNGVDFDIMYTVSLSDLVMERGKIPDLRRDIHSVMCLKFRTAQPVDTFETYYQYALRFLQFCVGRSNIGFSIRLYKCVEKVRYTILSRFVDGFDDYANDDLDCMCVINFDKLQSKLPLLFKTINGTNNQPNLLFLPKRNRDVGYVYHTNVSDLCAALEQEYHYSKNDIIANEREQAKALAKELNRFVNSSHYPMNVKDKAKSLNNGMLSNLQPSLREKIIALYEDFSVNLKAITNSKYYGNNGTLMLYNDEDFKKLIGKFVDIRNSVAHAGVEWNDGASIYQHLQLLLYFNIFKRAGYSLDESQNVLNNLFGWKFLY